MAMTRCKECGGQISTTATACPACGAKQVRTSGCAKVARYLIIAFVGFFVLMGVLGALVGRKTSPSPASPPAANTVPEKSIPPPPPAIGSQWIYSHDEDPMSGKVTHLAMTTSTNTVSFDSPYQGAQHGTLSVITHPRHGKNVIFTIEKGQLLCRVYDGCTVLIRFDEGTPQKFSANEPADHSSTMLFVSNYARFVAAMKKAKRVRIAAAVYQEGAPVFEFDVSGFDQAKYLDKPQAKPAPEKKTKGNQLS